MLIKTRYLFKRVKSIQKDKNEQFFCFFWKKSGIMCIESSVITIYQSFSINTLYKIIVKVYI